MIPLRAGRYAFTIATRRSGLSAPVKSLVAPPCEAGPRLGEVGRRILAPKGTLASRPSSTSSTSGPGSKGNGDAPKVSAAAEAGAEKKAAEASAGEATAKAAPEAEAAAANEVKPGTRGRNVMVGLVLVGFVAGTYFYTIGKMKKQDFLGDVEKEAEEEAMVNLHKSGLKVSPKVVPEGAKKAAGTIAEVPAKAVAAVEEVSTTVQAVVEDAGTAPTATSDPPAPEGTEKKKRKGWRKYWLFGPRVGGD